MCCEREDDDSLRTLVTVAKIEMTANTRTSWFAAFGETAAMVVTTSNGVSLVNVQTRSLSFDDSLEDSALV